MTEESEVEQIEAIIDIELIEPGSSPLFWRSLPGKGVGSYPNQGPKGQLYRRILVALNVNRGAWSPSSVMIIRN